MAVAKRFELFMGHLGNGITVCNKAVMENGDFKTIAHISDEGEIQWYVPSDYTPIEALHRIEQVAAEEKSKYDAWINSLPESHRYALMLEKMSTKELIEHIECRRKEKA